MLPWQTLLRDFREAAGSPLKVSCKRKTNGAGALCACLPVCFLHQAYQSETRPLPAPPEEGHKGVFSLVYTRVLAIGITTGFNLL